MPANSASVCPPLCPGGSQRPPNIMSGFCPARRGVSVVSVDVGPGVVPAGRVIGAAHGVPVSEGPGIVLVDIVINAVYGVLIVLVDVGSVRMVGTVCNIPVDARRDIVPVGREVDNSQRPPSIMTDVCPAPRLLVA